MSQGVCLQVGAFNHSENDSFLEGAEQVNDCLNADANGPQDFYDIQADLVVLN